MSKIFKQASYFDPAHMKSSGRTHTNRAQFLTINTSSVWIHLLFSAAGSLCRHPGALACSPVKMRPLSLSSRRSLCDLLSETHRSIIGVSWQCVSGTQQITAGCRPGGFAALLCEKRDGINADKHWRTRVIYDTSIKHSADAAVAAGTSLTLTGLYLHSTAKVVDFVEFTHITHSETHYTYGRMQGPARSPINLLRV